MTRPVLIPFRWVGTRLDIRAHLTGDEPLFVADDVCAALELFVDFEHREETFNLKVKIYPADTVLLPGADDPDGQPTRFFTAATVRNLGDERPMYAPDNGFLDWFEETFFTRPIEQLANLDPRDVPDMLRGESYSVRDSARILDRDPVLRNLGLGQTVLFNTLASDPFNWIRREEDHWEPNDEALAAGYLIRHRVRVPARHELYPQVRLTRPGLDRVHEQLGGVAELHITSAELEPLMEIS
jgi:hypothetical protein